MIYNGLIYKYNLVFKIIDSFENIFQRNFINENKIFTILNIQIITLLLLRVISELCQQSVSSGDIDSTWERSLLFLRAVPRDFFSPVHA